MEPEITVKRGRGRPRKNPLPTVVAKSTVIRRVVSSDGNTVETESLLSQLKYAGQSDPSYSGAVNGTERGLPSSPLNVTGVSRVSSAAASAAPAVQAKPEAIAPAPRKRGRPRKNPLPAEQIAVGAPAVTGGGVRRVRKDDADVEAAGGSVAANNFSIIEPKAIIGGESPLAYKGPGVRTGRQICIGSSVLSFYYIVFKNPERDELLFPATMHSIQHMISAAARENGCSNIVKVMPCGGRTAMEVAVLDAPSDFRCGDLRKVMLTAAYMEKLPESELTRCSNPQYQNFEDAHREICEFVKTIYGITVDSRSGDYSW